MGDAAANGSGKGVAHEKICSFWRRRGSWKRRSIWAGANREIVENGRTESRLRHYGDESKVNSSNFDPFLLFQQLSLSKNEEVREMGGTKTFCVTDNIYLGINWARTKVGILTRYPISYTSPYFSRSPFAFRYNSESVPALPHPRRTFSLARFPIIPLLALWHT
jgi:hypothetical protein